MTPLQFHTVPFTQCPSTLCIAFQHSTAVRPLAISPVCLLCEPQLILNQCHCTSTQMYIQVINIHALVLQVVNQFALAHLIASLLVGSSEWADVGPGLEPRARTSFS